MLRALGLAPDGEAGGDVLHAYRGLGPVDMLAAGAPGTHRADLEVFVADLDLAFGQLLAEVRHDTHPSERGVPALVGVEGADPDQSVHAVLGAQIAVGVGPSGHERGVLDPRFVPRLLAEELRLEAATLTPTKVHAQEDVGPVLRLCASGARVDGHDRIRVVIRGEHALELEPPNLAHERGKLRGDVSHHALVSLARRKLQ